MVVRFCLYSIFKNLRFFEPFFIVYLLAGPTFGGPSLNYFQIGALVGYQKLITGFLEIPSGFATDRWGRRRALALTFSFYVLAFPLYATSTWLAGLQQLIALYVAQTFFGLGEAFRTGSHKAIMLDWADETGADATRLIGLTRFFSKTSSGLSAIGGGTLLFLTGDFRWLFWAATVPAVLGVVLMLSYPAWLEGEMSRETGSAPRPGWGRQLRSMWATPGILFLMLQSTLFESQIKLAQHYIQPFLKQQLELSHVAVIGGVGALAIGLYYLVQDLLGGAASMLSLPLERRSGHPLRALHGLYVAAIVSCGLLALGLHLGASAIGVVIFVVLAVLQNCRRPIFVAQFNRVMDKPQRAATLSIESQARTWIVAILAPVTGWLVDHFGLSWAFISIALIFVAGLLLNLLPKGVLQRPRQDAEARIAGDRA